MTNEQQENLNAQIRDAISRYEMEQARNLLRSALQDPSAETYYLASLVAVADWQCKEFLEKALSLDPFHVEASIKLGKLKEREGDHSILKKKIGKLVPTITLARTDWVFGMIIIILIVVLIAAVRGNIGFGSKGYNAENAATATHEVDESEADVVDEQEEMAEPSAIQEENDTFPFENLKITTENGENVDVTSFEFDILTLGDNEILVAQDKRAAYLPSINLGSSIDSIALLGSDFRYKTTPLNLQPFDFDLSAYQLLGNSLDLMGISNLIDIQRMGAATVLFLGNEDDQLVEPEGLFDLYDSGISNVFFLMDTNRSLTSSAKDAKPVSSFFNHVIIHVILDSFYHAAWSVALEARQNALIANQLDCNPEAAWSCVTVYVTNDQNQPIQNAKVKLHYDLVGLPKDYLVYIKETDAIGRSVFPLIADVLDF
jgi:hypothetical protein